MVGDELALSKIGIITFHSAYNYGSVLQAFATQTFIKKLGSEMKLLTIDWMNREEFTQI